MFRAMKNIAIALLVAGPAAIAAAQTEGEPDGAPLRLTVAAGPEGSHWRRLAEIIADRVAQAGSPLELTVSDSDSGGNIRALEDGGAALAITTLDRYFDYLNASEEAEPMRLVLPLELELFSISVAQGSWVTGFEDLFTASLGIGRAGWSSTRLTEEMLHSLGLEPEKRQENGGILLPLTPNASIAKIRQGQLDAIATWTPAPDWALPADLRRISLSLDRVSDASNQGRLAGSGLAAIRLSDHYDPITANTPWTYARLVLLIGRPDLPDRAAAAIVESVLSINSDGARIAMNRENLRTLKLAADPENRLPAHPAAVEPLLEGQLLPAIDPR